MSVCVLGSINLDIVASVDRLPQAGETVIAQRVELFPGGKGANQATAAARMGADTMMIGAVGADDSGARMRATLESVGVNTKHIKTLVSHPTGQAYINVAASGENSIVVAAGANHAVTPDLIATDALSGCKVFLAQLEVPLSTIEALFQSEPAQRGTTILNAAPAHAAAANIFPLASILVVNETELASYAGLKEIPTQSDAVIAAARRLICREGQTIVVTLGAQGAIAVNTAHDQIIPGRTSQVMDTTGAGDCFCGVLAATLAADRTLEQAMKLAVTAASLSVERAGASTSMPTRAEVESLMAT